MNNLQIKLENDRIFREGSFPEMRSEVVTELSGATISGQKLHVSDCIIKTDTISAILTHGRGKTIALNFANAMFPGGGYILGGNAQEEALCRASMLYYTIRTAKSYYRRNRLHVLPTYTDAIIYSENVPILRDNSGKLLETPMLCDFITCPAVNRTFARFLFSQKKLDTIMQNRIDKIIQLAAEKQPDTLILGAFGCGVFGNRRETVYPLFESAIARYLPASVKIIFADPK